jgi:hypothetical protein
MAWIKMVWIQMLRIKMACVKQQPVELQKKWAAKLSPCRRPVPGLS